jgi:hypothetical protein
VTYIPEYANRAPSELPAELSEAHMSLCRLADYLEATESDLRLRGIDGPATDKLREVTRSVWALAASLED